MHYKLHRPSVFKTRLCRTEQLGRKTCFRLAYLFDVVQKNTNNIIIITVK